MRKLYLAVSRDKYELPVAVSDTPGGLADLCGTTKGTVLSVISHAKERKCTPSYLRIKYTEKEWDDDDYLFNVR